VEPGRDGRYRLECPNCGAAYAVPETHLDSRILCKNCRSGFHPRQVLERPARRRRRRSAPWKGPVFFGGGVLLLAVLLIALGSGRKPPRKAPPPKKTVMLDLSHPAWLAVEETAKAVAARDEVTLASSLDLEWIWNHREGKNRTVWKLATAEAKRGFQKALFQDLFEGERGRFFREHVLDGLYDTKAVPRTAETLTFQVEASPRAEGWIGMGLMEVVVGRSGNLWRLREWTVRKRASAPVAKRKKPKRHKLIPKPKAKVVKVGEKKVKVWVSKPVPLPHLEDTPPGLRKEIDDAIALIMDPEADIRKVRAAQRRLVEIGKPAVPRLLTRFYETKGSTFEERTCLRLVMDTFNDITGAGITYAPGRADDVTFGGTDDLRKTALGQAYAFWWRYFSKKEFQTMDPEEPLPPPRRGGSLKPPRRGK